MHKAPHDARVLKCVQMFEEVVNFRAFHPSWNPMRRSKAVRIER